MAARPASTSSPSSQPLSSRSLVPYRAVVSMPAVVAGSPPGPRVEPRSEVRGADVGNGDARVGKPVVFEHPAGPPFVNALDPRLVERHAGLADGADVLRQLAFDALGAKPELGGDAPDGRLRPFHVRHYQRPGRVPEPSGFEGR